MLVEMGHEEAAAAKAKEPADNRMEAEALRELIAAGLVTHEAIGDPARLSGEAATLRAICGLVAGPVYRLEPFHYAFTLRPEDLGDMLAELEPAARTAALEAALTATLGPEAVRIGATDLPPEETKAVFEAFPEGLPSAPVLLLRAQAGAVAAGLDAAGPGVQAVIDGTYAVEYARLAARSLGSGREGAVGDARSDDRLAAIEAAVGDIRVTLEAQAETAALTARLNQALNTVLKRLDVQSGVLHAYIAREDIVAERLGELARIAAGPAGLQEKLGLTLAEFLAGMQRRSESGAPETGLRREG
jgi:hypothetical protein